MKKTITTLTMALLSPLAFGQNSCGSIKSDKLRLQCYDKAAVEKQNIAATAPEATKVEPMKKGISFKSGSWSVNQEQDAMTDKKKCTAIYEGAWIVQASEKDFYVSLRGRGGVRGYTVRFDDEPALPLRLADEMERDLSAVRLGKMFDQIYAAKRIRMQISTILNTVVAQDIDLKGFAESVDYMRQNCKD